MPQPRLVADCCRRAIMNHHTAHIPKAWIQFFSLIFHLTCIFLLGIMTGFFGAYSGNVNLAMLQMDGSTYALVQSALNRNVRHALFFVCFFGPAVVGLLTLTSSATQWRLRWWRLLAGIVLVYGLGIIFFTREVNLPLNALTESWTPATLPVNWAETRDTWNRANLWRSILSALLFFSAIVSLWMRSTVQHPRP